MSTDAPDQIEGEIASENQQVDSNLGKRLSAWAEERSWNPLNSERKARGWIVKAALKDINGPAGDSLKDKVIESTGEMKRKIDRLIPPGQSEYETDDKTDSITKEKYKVKFRKEPGDVYVAEELGPNLDVISQARIYPNGATELTLNFTGVRYVDREKGIDRNPRIVIDKNFPRAAVEVFNLLVKYN